MNSLDDEEFSETPFYHEREAAILQLLKQSSLIRPPVQGASGAAIYDFTNAIHYAGCVAGSLGIPLDSESVGVHLSLLYRNTARDRWPEVSRILSELYARAHRTYIARLKASFVPDQTSDLSEQEAPVVAARLPRKRHVAVSTPPPHHAARKSKKPIPAVLKRP